EDAFRRLAECGAEAEQIEFTKHCLAPASAERPKDAGAVATAIAAQLAAGEERAHKAELEAAEARAHEQEERARLAEQEVAAKEQEAHAAKAKRQAERARARQREERRRAESEHRRRLLVIAIAAVLLLAVAIGGGGYLISAGEEHARRERVEMAVSDALQKALELEGARELAQALVSAKAAADLARDADSATLSAAEEAAARIQAEIKRDVSARRKWERDRKLLDELRAVSLRSYDDWSRSQMDEKYVATFRRHGIDFEKQSVSRIARLVRQSSDPVELAAFLDEWAVSRRYWRLADWRTPLEASRLGDPDPVRNRMRAACASDDAVTLRRLMETADTAAMPVRSQALLGYIADSVGETAAAQAYLQRVRRRHPGNLWVNTALACTLINRRPEEAVRYLTAAQALRPGSAGGQAHLAIALAAAGNFAQADAMCRSLRERFPDSTYTCSALAYVRAERRDWRGTIEAAEQWRERKEQASVYQLLTVAHLKLLDLDAALAASREAVRIRSADLIGHVLNLCNLTIRLACNGEFDEAIASARRATELLPDRPHGWCAWCYPLTFQGKSDEAIEKLRRSLECDPEHVDANHCLGEILMRWKGAWEEAHAHIQAALKVEPRNPAALDSLADCYRYRGDLDRAIQATEQALRTDPKCAAAWITRARCYLDLGDLAQADECANNALRIDSGRARAYYVLGEVHARQGNHEDAIAAFGEAIRRKTGHWFALYQRSLYALHLAQSLMHLGRYDEARESLRQAAVLDREPHTAPLTARERRDYEIAVKVCDAILALGDRKTPETREQTMALAHRAYHEGRFAEAVGHFKAIQPEFRYRATCAAARAGAQFRPQCLEWLQAELEDARRRADHDPIDVRLDLQAWKRARDLAGVRDPIPLAKLPDSERAGWVPFWRDVDALLARAREAQ
ncbi:MAG: tetratricopeptide repeat protein, partial [Planctomycetota bacterium]